MRPCVRVFFAVALRVPHAVTHGYFGRLLSPWRGRVALGFVALALFVAVPRVATADFTWNADLRLTNNPEGSWFPSVTSDPSGNVHVVWFGNDEIYYKRWDGVVWTADLRLTNGAGLSMDAAIASDPDGNVHVVWEDNRDDPGGDNLEIYYKRWEGVAWTADERLTNSPWTCFGPSVASDSSGNVHVVWVDIRQLYQFEIYYKRWDGVTWTPDLRLTNSPGNSFGPSVTSDPSGKVHVVWEDERDEPPGYYEIYYKRWDGVAWTTDLRLTNSPGGSSSPSVASDPSGNVHVVWTSDGIDDSEIYYKRWDGASWTPDLQLTNSPGYSEDSSVASDPSGNVHVVWEDERDGPRGEIYYKRWDGAVWTPDQRLTNSPGSSVHPSLASDPSGNVHVVWEDERDGDPQIYYKRGCVVPDITKDYGWKYNCLEPACPPDPGTCPNPISTMTDGQGNRFVMICEDAAFFCITYQPFGGPELMVAKCPWYGALNYSLTLWGIPYASGEATNCPQDFPNCPKQWVSYSHWSQDFRDDFCGPYPPGGGMAGDFYCDDWEPQPMPEDGLFDWVDREFTICAGHLVVTHYTSRDAHCPLPDPPEEHGYDVRVVSPPCQFDLLFPPFVNANCRPPPGDAAGSEPDRMTIASTAIPLAGNPAGGAVTLHVRSRSVRVLTEGTNTVEEVAEALSVAANSDPGFPDSGVHVSVEGANLILHGTSKNGVALEVEDAGMESTPPPVDFTYSLNDSTVELHWSNSASYDAVHITKQHHLLGYNLPGATEDFVDDNPWGTPLAYLIVAWRNGLSSAPVQALPATVGLGSEPHSVTPTVKSLLMVTPNPASKSAVVSYSLLASARVTVAVYDIRGRYVATILDANQAAGEHAASWDLRLQSGGRVPRGVYLVNLSVDGRFETSKVVVIE